MTLTSHLSETQILSKFPSFSSQFRKPIFILHYKCLFKHQNSILSSVRAFCSINSAASYNGWDDRWIWVDSDELGESNHFKKFLISLGMNDKKYVFSCMLGFVCALAISRVRVSSIIVFPAVAVVFAVGFSFGLANRKPQKNLGFNGTKMKIHAEKLKGLVEIFDGIELKISDLRNDLKTAIECERVELGDLESCVNAVETIGGFVLNARNLVDGCIGLLIEGQEVGKNMSQKNSQKKKENGGKGFDLFGFVGSFVKGNAGESKSCRMNSVRRGDLAKDVVDRGLEDSRAVEGASDWLPNVDGNLPFKETVSNDSRKNRLGGKDQEKRILRRGERNTDAYMKSKDYLSADEYDYQNIRFTSNRRFSLNMSAHRETRKWVSEDCMSSNLEFDFSKEHLENEGFLRNQQIFRNSNGAYSYEGKENINFGRFREGMPEEKINEEDKIYSKKYQHRSQNDTSSFSSSAVSDDMLFDKYLRKANDLLKEAKDCLRARDDEMLAEEMLQECANLLCQAIGLRPMSLLAIGQLGNTYLLHGEVKLKISRELRTLLSESDDFGVERSNLFTLEDTLPSKNGIEHRLISSCEECESLLVEAGRKYRVALSIDGNDVRALYNWGLALSFRAQLIADVGPEAALDADKLFLASIDKFNAMMSKSNDYAPEALFRWGMALQQRSRLRPNNSRDKVKLLQQAKRLYEDAANMGSNNLQVRKALSSCISELNFTDI